MKQTPWNEGKPNNQVQQGIFDMSARLTHALDVFADTFFAEYDSDEEDDDDDDDDEEDGLPGLDLSTLTMSTTVDESREIRVDSYSNSRDASSEILYSPPIERSPRARSRTSPGLASTYTTTSAKLYSPRIEGSPPARSSTSSTLSSTNKISSTHYHSNESLDSRSDHIDTENSFDTANSSILDASIDFIIARESEHDSSAPNDAHTEILIQVSPMARMRSGEIATASRIPERKSRSSLRNESGEDVVASKHRKWRRQILDAQRRKEAEKKQLRQKEVAGFSAPSILFNSDPAKLFQQLVKCGNLEDSGSFSDASFSDDRSHLEDVEHVVDRKSRKRFSSHDKKKVSPSGRTKPARRKPERPSPIERSQGSIDGIVEGDSFETAHSSGMESNKSMLSELDMQDRNFIKVFIAEASQVGYPFIWHMPSPDGMNFQDPVPIVAFLELGFSQAEGDFAGPRLAWYNPEGYNLGAIDLLDIRSLAKAEKLHLDEFPYALPGTSMILKLHNSFEVLVLEASSTDSAKRFIHGLRWVVARLTFNLVIGNPHVSCEMLDLTDTPPSNYEAEMNRAMNEVSNQLVDKSVFSNPQRLV